MFIFSLQIFEKYDDNDIGCLPHEDIEGVGSIQNTFSPDELLRLTEDVNSKDDDDVDLDLKTKTLLAAAKQDCAEEEEDIVIVDDGMPKWDCESILSTYSNIYNHPAKISESKVCNIFIYRAVYNQTLEVLRHSQYKFKHLKINHII